MKYENRYTLLIFAMLLYMTLIKYNNKKNVNNFKTKVNEIITETRLYSFQNGWYRGALSIKKYELDSTSNDTIPFEKLFSKDSIHFEEIIKKGRK